MRWHVVIILVSISLVVVWEVTNERWVMAWQWKWLPKPRNYKAKPRGSVTVIKAMTTTSPSFYRHEASKPFCFFKYQTVKPFFFFLPNHNTKMSNFSCFLPNHIYIWDKDVNSYLRFRKENSYINLINIYNL